MHDFMLVSKALADENRVRVLMALQGRELCVCQVIELLGLAPSTVSKHMSILKTARLIESRKEGRWIYYRLSVDLDNKVTHGAIDWVEASLSENPLISSDTKRIEKILKMDQEELCRCQKC